MKTVKDMAGKLTAANKEIVRLNEELKKRDTAARMLLDSNAAVIAMMVERSGGRMMIDAKKFGETQARIMATGVPYAIHKTPKHFVFRMKTDAEYEAHAEELEKKSGVTENGGEKVDS